MSTSILGDLTEFLALVKTDCYVPDMEILPDIHMRVVITETVRDKDQLYSDQCVAMVQPLVNGVKAAPYQCTRRKKHGHYCGLHNNKQTQFVHVSEYRAQKKEIHTIRMSDVITT
jgi:copper(I)-binding protein